jgi:hypothetical protein
MSDTGGANPHEDIVLRSVAKKARGAVLAAACFLIPALGIALVALTATDEASRPSRLFAVPMFPILMFGAAWCWFRSRSFFGGAGSEVARVLLEPRSDVVWVYPHETRVRINFITPVTVSNDVVIACRDGRCFYLPIPLGTADRLLSTVRALAPTAAVGYSADRDAKFRRDPRSLVLEGA